jgi:hypothetical protein
MRSQRSQCEIKSIVYRLENLRFKIYRSDITKNRLHRPSSVSLVPHLLCLKIPHTSSLLGLHVRARVVTAAPPFAETARRFADPFLTQKQPPRG